MGLRSIKRLILSFVYKKKLTNKKKCIFKENCVVDKNTIFEGCNLVSNDTQINNCYFGFASYVSHSSQISSCFIGKYSCIGPMVKTVIGTHPTRNFVSLHPAFYSLKKQVGFTYAKDQLFNESIKKYDKYNIKIGNDVWVGANVTILDGVSIGDGAVIAAGSVVINDIEEYSIVGGVPAKLIRYRFSNENIKFLIKLKWWEKNDIWKKKYSKYFNDIEEFRKVIEDEINK